MQNARHGHKVEKQERLEKSRTKSDIDERDGRRGDWQAGLTLKAGSELQFAAAGFQHWNKIASPYDENDEENLLLRLEKSQTHALRLYKMAWCSTPNPPRLAELPQSTITAVNRQWAPWVSSQILRLHNIPLGVLSCRIQGRLTFNK